MVNLYVFTTDIIMIVEPTANMLSKELTFPLPKVID